MTELLLRLFVKGYRGTDTAAVRFAVGRLAGITGIVCNVLLFLGKLAVGLAAGSLSVIADAVNNITDASSSLVVLLGFRMAKQPADEDHPYGHGRYEYLAGFVVAALILVIGGSLGLSSVKKILQPAPASYSVLTFCTVAGAVALKGWMTVFFSSLGKRIRSTALHAAAADCRNDVIATAAVLAGCLAEYFFSVRIDGYIGLGVAVFIFWSGIRLVQETVSPLLGKQADPELMEQISRVIRSSDRILGFHDLLVHDYGPGQCFASVHVELSAAEDPLVCHEIIDGIEHDVLELLQVHLVIHYDPVVENNAEWDEMRSVLEKIIGDVDGRLSMHDFRMVQGTRQTKLVFDLAVPYTMGHQHRDIKHRIDKALAERGKEYVTVIHFDGKA